MKKIIFLVAVALVTACGAVGLVIACTTRLPVGRESTRVSYNLSKEADNFNVQRKLTVLNARTDSVLLEMTGNFSLENNDAGELEIICEIADGVYQKHFVYLNKETLYVVEDVSNTGVSKYHYEMNIIPRMIGGVTVTAND